MSKYTTRRFVENQFPANQESVSGTNTTDTVDQTQQTQIPDLVRPRRVIPIHNMDTLTIPFPCNSVFCGKNQAGKNVALRRFMELHSHNFHLIYAVIGSKGLNKDWDWLPEDNQIDARKIFKVQAMHKYLKDAKRAGANLNVLLIFDDIVGILNTHTGKTGEFFNELITSGRHANLSTIILTQKLTKLSPTIRDNVHNFCVMRVNGRNITDVLFECQENYDDKYKLLNIYQQHLRTSYAIMSIIRGSIFLLAPVPYP